MMRKTLPMLLAALAAPLAAQSTLFDTARGAPTAPGQWIYTQTLDGSEARFAGLFAIRCTRSARLVALRRLDIVAPAPLTIATDLMARTVPASGVLGSSDRLLDAIAFSRGRFLVNSGAMPGGATVGGMSAPRLVIPASPEAARSIEDCRN